MSGAYLHFKSCYTHEELVEHFLLTPAELQLVFTCRGDANRCGMALLLKALVYLGYVPEKLNSIPGEVRSFIAGQLGLLWDFCEQYPRDIRTRKGTRSTRSSWRPGSSRRPSSPAGTADPRATADRRLELAAVQIFSTTSRER